MTNKYQGEPCGHCSSTERYVKGNACVRCRKAYNREAYEDTRTLAKAASQARYKANTQRYLDLMWEGSLRRKFGLTVADYQRMLTEQGGKCKICEIPCQTGRRLAVDHDHTTKAVRGLLCQGCNTGLGKFKDSPALLTRAAKYLQGP